MVITINSARKRYPNALRTIGAGVAWLWLGAIHLTPHSSANRNRASNTSAAIRFAIMAFASSPTWHQPMCRGRAIKSKISEIL